MMNPMMAMGMGGGMNMMGGNFGMGGMGGGMFGNNNNMMNGIGMNENPRNSTVDSFGINVNNKNIRDGRGN
jgi:hypothetical protein